MNAKKMLACAATGGIAAYLFDPQAGARRRAEIRNKLIHLRMKAVDFADAARRDAANRAQGMKARMRMDPGGGPVDDRVLEERVRSVLGGASTHPRAIYVEASGGCVRLSGPIFRDEERRVLRRARRTPGVSAVENAMQAFEEAGQISSLQGEGRLPQRFRSAWSPTSRIAATAAGGAMALLGMKRKSLGGMAAAAGGMALAARAITNKPMSKVTGVGAGRGAVEIHKTLDVQAPIEEVFALWSDYARFPQFLSHVRDVRMLPDDRSRWVVDGPAGRHVEWTARETARVPNKMIAWRSEPDSLVENAGRVLFQESETGTRLDVTLSYTPPGGLTGHMVSEIFHVDPKRQMDDDLMRMKTMLETGNPARDAAAGEKMSKQTDSR